MGTVSNGRDGLLVVRRLDWANDLPLGNPMPNPLVRSPSGGLSDQEVLARYRGIDGMPWPGVPSLAPPTLERGLAPLSCHDEARAYFAAASGIWKCDLLYLMLKPKASVACFATRGFELLGYDFGYYESEWGVFSCLFHEVIYGLYDEMSALGATLNRNLLLPDLRAGRAAEEVRARLAEAGADLESDLGGDPLPSLIAVYAAD